MNRSAIVMLLPLLAACHVQSKIPASNDNDVAIQADENGSVAFNLPILQGQVKLPAAMMHKGDFDIDGVKLMPGSSVTGFSVLAGDKGSTVDMAFIAPASPDDTRTYFLDHFKEKGVQAAASGDGISGTTRDGGQFVMHLAGDPKGTKGRISVRSKD